MHKLGTLFAVSFVAAVSLAVSLVPPARAGVGYVTPNVTVYGCASWPRGQDADAICFAQRGAPPAVEVSFGSNGGGAWHQVDPGEAFISPTGDRVMIDAVVDGCRVRLDLVREAAAVDEWSRTTILAPHLVGVTVQGALGKHTALSGTGGYCGRDFGPPDSAWSTAVLGAVAYVNVTSVPPN